MWDEHVKNLSGYSFLWPSLLILLNLNEVCHSGEYYVLKLLNNEDDDGM